jgi:DNA polymerase III sliding clamp (beta) subunit (PCNA family)
MFYDIVRKLPEGNEIELAKDGEQGRLIITSGQPSSRSRLSPPMISGTQRR